MVVSFDDDFEEAIRDLDFFSSELVKIIENELDRLLRDMEVDRVGDSSDADRQRLGCDRKAGSSRFSSGESLVEPTVALVPSNT